MLWFPTALCNLIHDTNNKNNDINNDQGKKLAVKPVGSVQVLSKLLIKKKYQRLSSFFLFFFLSLEFHTSEIIVVANNFTGPTGQTLVKLLCFLFARDRKIYSL